MTPDPMTTHSLGGGTRPRRLPAFTLVELLVVITIVIVLAALAFTMLRRGKTAAERASCINRLRQVANMLISSATDNGGRLQVIRDGSGEFDFLPYFIVRDQLELPAEPFEAHYSRLRDVMFCPSAPEPEQKTAHLHTYGVNFAPNVRAGVTWKDELVEDSEGRTGTLATLPLASVSGPSNYPLVADSCQSNGQQTFRILDADRIGLRHGGRANAAFLDGSARSLGQEDLGKLGFKDAYDTSTKPPEVVDLSDYNP